MDNLDQLKRVLSAAKTHPLYAKNLGNIDIDSFAPEQLHTLPLVGRGDWLEYIKANPTPPSGSALMHLTPSPTLAWMPEYLSQADVEYQAQALACHMRRLGLAGKKVVVAFGYHVFAGGWLFHEALQQAGALVLPHGPGEAERIAQLQKLYGFEVLVSNPSFALKVAQAGGRFELLLAAGEPFTSVPGYRERVEAAIEGKALDAFGTSEIGIVAAEGLDRQGLLEIPEMAFIEIIDPQTLEPTPSGEKGEMVITALSRTQMPMIRFRTGDLAVVEREGGHLRLPRGVIGRTDQMVKVKGVKLYPTELVPILIGHGLEAKNAQVVVESKEGGTDKLTLRLKANQVPSGLETALQKATGLRFDALVAEPDLEGPMLIDKRYG